MDSSVSSTSQSSTSDTEFDDIDLTTVPARELNVSSRMALAWYLNPEQPLRSSQGVARDYRGLAEQMGFQYNDIKNFRRNEDPTMKVLEAWEGKPDATIGLLVEYLKNMERHDVLEDITEQFRRDAQNYVKRTIMIYENPIQVPEVTSGPPAAFPLENPCALTISDVVSGGCTYYDAYICYAREDLEFVFQLVKYLESHGLKLFIKDRDLLCGTSEHDAYVQLIQERCNRMLIILSPDFLRSPECEFQASFATGLAMEQRKRKLIPVLIKPCEVPLILKYLSKIDFTKPAIPDFLWARLISSIRGTPCSVFVAQSSNTSSRPTLPSPQLPHSNSNPSSPLITFPPTEIHTDSLSSQGTLTWSSVSSESPVASQQQLLVATCQAKASPSSKQKWYRSIKERFTSSSASSSANAYSAATSGYHSNSSLAVGNREESGNQIDTSEATV